MESDYAGIDPSIQITQNRHNKTLLHCTKFGYCKPIRLEMLLEDKIILHASVFAHGFSHLVFQESTCGEQQCDTMRPIRLLTFKCYIGNTCDFMDICNSYMLHMLFFMYLPKMLQYRAANR